ncbi:type I restriction enzyme, S subunit [Enterococcus durans]|uniref:Type I restriction enzyme, S subunit n=1 Tax=Enterococcus durans TaxID=53345 RepID=A0A377MTT1_9ENTE|nr:restriction endonuclease subunit S [Enterococcus durans]STQ32997.1 type I restriction enzyme, S subunit [Enterococcus durans]
MAKIDDSVKKKVPELRFKGFTDEWEERKLGELLKSAYQGINTAGDKVIYSEKGVEILQSKHITSGYITFDDTRFLDKKRYSEYFPKYVPKKHDILFANIGTIGPSTVVETNKEFLIAWNILKMTPNENANSRFIELFLQILNEKHYYKKITTGNATKFVNKDAILNIELCISSFKEQQKIGSFFKQLDDTVTLHQRKLDLLKEQKKGYLQKMFPKNGAKVPELRFAGFADDWEERKLGEVSKYSNGGSYENDVVENGTYELITLKSVNMSGKLVSSGKFINRETKTLEKDTLVMILSEQAPGLLGMTAKIPENNRYVLNQRVAEIKPNTNIDSYFLSMSINRSQAYFSKRGAGTKVQNISKPNVENFEFYCPSEREQQKIGSFFKHLDDTITLHQRKLDLLKEQKKGFLQKMFV